MSAAILLPHEERREAAPQPMRVMLRSTMEDRTPQECENCQVKLRWDGIAVAATVPGPDCSRAGRSTQPIEVSFPMYSTDGRAKLR